MPYIPAKFKPFVAVWMSACDALSFAAALDYFGLSADGRCRALLGGWPQVFDTNRKLTFTVGQIQRDRGAGLEGIRRQSQLLMQETD